MRYATCHPDNQYFANGLCRPCYYREKNAEWRAALTPQQQELRRAQAREAYYRRRDDIPTNEQARPDARKPECHPDKRHYARGLCMACYRKLAKNQKDFARATCHPDKPHIARGLCSTCYSNARYARKAEEERDKQSAARKRTRSRLREGLLDAYGRRCACQKCPETNVAFLTIDHIGGGGVAHRKEINSGGGLVRRIRDEGYPTDKYRLLCMNCNLMTKGGRICPHMESTEE
jgi:hypothetical protein